jgi:hypothetical protein
MVFTSAYQWAKPIRSTPDEASFRLAYFIMEVNFLSVRIGELMRKYAPEKLG